MHNQYRVWDTQAQEYVPNVAFDQYGTFFIDHAGSGGAYTFALDQEGRYIVEFATGYPDKNGTMIFEGDIIQDVRGRIQEVVWSDFSDGLNVSGQTWMFGRSQDMTLYDQLEEELHSIGTIHTTPDLLPKEEEKTVSESDSKC